MGDVDHTDIQNSLQNVKKQVFRPLILGIVSACRPSQHNCHILLCGPPSGLLSNASVADVSRSYGCRHKAWLKYGAGKRFLCIFKADHVYHPNRVLWQHRVCKILEKDTQMEEALRQFLVNGWITCTRPKSIHITGKTRKATAVCPSSPFPVFCERFRLIIAGLIKIYNVSRSLSRSTRAYHHKLRTRHKDSTYETTNFISSSIQKRYKFFWISMNWKFKPFSSFR